MLASSGTRPQPLSSRASDGRVPRRWLILARGAWIVCALLLANFVTSAAFASVLSRRLSDAKISETTCPKSSL